MIKGKAPIYVYVRITSDKKEQQNSPSTKWVLL